MRHTTQQISRNTRHDGTRRETSRADQAGVTATHRTTVRRASFVLPILLTLAAASVMYYFRFSIAHNIWTAASSPAIGSVLLAMVLTVGVCGSLACGVIWWICQRELRANVRHRAELKQHPAVHCQPQTNTSHRDAA